LRRLAATILAVAGAIAPATGAFAPASGAFAQGNSSPPATIGIRLLEAPVALSNDPRARVYIIDHLPPGATISRRIGVSNTGDKPVSIQLYGGAATVDGGSFIAAPQGQNNDLATWITTSPHILVVPPHGEATATVTITVPTDATPGERYGVVWAQPPASTGSGGIAEINRVGIRVYLSVGSGPTPVIDFTINSLTASRDQSGAPYVQALVHNTGGRALDLSGSLSLTNGPGGVRAGPFPAKLGTTLGIGQTEPVTVPLDRSIPSGPWTATITLTSDQVTREATAVITFPAVAGSSSPPVAAKAVHHHRGPSFIILTVIAAITLFAILLLLFLLWRRRKDEDDEEQTARGPRVGTRA
jgi:hypothetical protein